MTALARIAISAVALSVVVVACGARTGLLAPEPIAPDFDAASDVVGGEASDEADVSHDEGPNDGLPECTPETYCDPSDPAHLYRCGAPFAQCGDLEQCEKRDGKALCINPCVDSLGNDTSNGCEFYAVEMDTNSDARGVCYAVFVVNQWKSGERAKMEVTVGNRVLPLEQFARIPAGHGTGITYDSYQPAVGLPSNQVAVLFLSRDPSVKVDGGSAPSDLADCPPGVTPAIVGDAALHGTGKATAFRIRTNVPVVAYQMLPYGGGRARVTGATLLLPTSAWSTNYVVADAYQAPTMFPAPGPTTVVIARQDATNVTIKPTADILPGRALAGTAAGMPVTYMLNQGEYLQFTQQLELTGSAVVADKPVAVIGGSTLMDIPVTQPRADSAEQMLPPVRALGSEYVAARYRNRAAFEESVPWRIVGVVDGTQLTYDPAPPAGAPAIINAQELREFNDPGPWVVRSQDANHPFYMASYMTGGCGEPRAGPVPADAGPADGGVDFGGCPTDSPLRGRGDPEFVNVVPPAQYLPRYTFFTDPTYPETNLVVIRVRDAKSGQMPDVALDCAGRLSGWQPVGAAGTYEMTRVDLSTGDFQAVGACDNGVHSITASFASEPPGGPALVARFGVTIWGWGNDITWPSDKTAEDEANPKFTRWVSYGYPAGADFKPLNTAQLSAQ
jgi:IgGFc binding protein